MKVEEMKGCRRRVEVEVPAEAVDDAFRSSTRNWVRQVQITGFRKGKAPAHLVRQKYRGEIEHEVRNRLVRDHLVRALEEKKLTPIQDPRLESVDLREGSPMVFRAVFDVLPEIHPGDYKGRTVRATRKPVTDEDVEESLKGLQKRAARLLPVEGRAVRPGDILFGTLAGHRADGEGQPIPERAVRLDLEDPDLFPEFQAALPGMEAGQDRTVQVAYPADHPDPELKGNTFEYRFVLREIKERELPPLDDDLAREVGSFETLGELRDHLRRQLEKGAEGSWQAEARREILDQILASHRFDLPESLVEAELHSRVEEIMVRMNIAEWDRERAEKTWNELWTHQRPAAERGVRASLLLEAIAGAEGIEVGDREMNDRLREEAARQKSTVAKMKDELVRADRWNALKRAVLRELTLDFLVQNANIP